MHPPFSSRLLIIGAGAALAIVAGARTLTGRDTASSGTYEMRVGAVRLQSAGVMQFGPDGTLFVADSRAGAVYAVDVAETGRDTSTTALRIDDVDGKIAAALGTTRDQIRVRDMVAHPLSQSLYFSVARGRGESATAAIIRIAKKDGRVSLLPMESIRHARAELPDAPAPEAKNRWGESTRTLAITDLALANGELYVAGLSNEEFSSALRRIPYPFAGSAKTTTVEIFHTSHDQYETASPIASMLPMTLGGKDVVLASYTCSPLAVFDRADLTAKRHVRGRTVAELGGGNRPLDMIRYVSPASGKEYVLIANSDRTLMRLDAAEIADAPALTTPVKQAYQPAGVGYLPVASFGVLQLDTYNARNVVLLQRDPEDGSLKVRTLGLNWL
jgi:hypothetical protein